MPSKRNTNLSHLLQNAKVAPNLYSPDGRRYVYKAGLNPKYLTKGKKSLSVNKSWALSSIQ